MMTTPLLRPSRRSPALTGEQCYGLLASQQVGRLAWQVGRSPRIVAVSYAWQDGAVYVRTSSEGVLVELSRPTEVALEVDELDPDTRAGWSVVLHGRSEPVAGPENPRQRWKLDSLAPWARGVRTLVIKILPHQVSGRVIRRFCDL